MKNLIITFIFLLLSAVSPARYYSPDEITNPNIADRRVYVSDPGDLVSQEAKDRASSVLYRLRLKTGAEVVVAVIPSIGDIPIETYSEKLFTRWGIGKSDKDNGVLILIAPEQRKTWITTGYGVEGVLPDISAKKIVDNTIIPNMRQGDIDAAVVSSAMSVARVLSDPAAAEELRSDEKEAWQKNQDAISSGTLFSFLKYVAFALLVVEIIVFCMDLAASRGKDRYQSAMVWHRHRSLYWVLALCSMGMGIIVALLAEWQYHRRRNRPMKCPTCGTKMRKLNEEEDNSLLNPSQDLEEQLKTVDYDVWVCPECGTVERYPFRAKQMKYTECPNCHTVAMCEVKDHTLVPPTTRREGMGEKVYECMFCHHQNRHKYVIPKKDDGAAAALAAGAILGSMGRGGSGGGGGFGGGFGGGATGGGGAGGGW